MTSLTGFAGRLTKLSFLCSALHRLHTKRVTQELNLYVALQCLMLLAAFPMLLGRDFSDFFTPLGRDFSDFFTPLGVDN